MERLIYRDWVEGHKSGAEIGDWLEHARRGECAKKKKKPPSAFAGAHSVLVRVITFSLFHWVLSLFLITYV